MPSLHSTGCLLLWSGDWNRGTAANVCVTDYLRLFTHRTALDSILMRLFRLCKVDKQVDEHRTARLRVEGTIWVLLSLVLAIFVPEILYIINPLGGLAAAFILIFPGSECYCVYID